MTYDLKAMDSEIQRIEESAVRLRDLAAGIESVERNAEAILAFVFLLQRNVSDMMD